MITIFTMQQTTPKPELKQLEDRIEKELLDVIIEHLKSGELELEKAQILSQEFLSLLPFHDKAELLKKLGSLSGRYQEIQMIFAKYAGELEREQSSQKVVQMTEHIKAGNIEAAIQIAKGGT